MKKILLSSLFPAVLALVVTLSVPGATSAQERKPKTAGNIELEVATEKKDPYLLAQEQSLAFFKELKNQLPATRTSNRKLMMPDANVIHYMNGLYLFCSLKRGACPEILESLFEVDVVNSRLSNATVCPVMKGFWKRYLENDFEDRLKYNLSTGLAAKVNDFNSHHRPRFLRCEDTLKDLFKGGESAQALFTTRYAPGSRSLKAVDEVITLINAIITNQINVFQATGAQS